MSLTVSVGRLYKGGPSNYSVECLVEDIVIGHLSSAKFIMLLLLLVLG